jgi:hypothetical protein
LWTGTSNPAKPKVRIEIQNSQSGPLGVTVRGLILFGFHGFYIYTIYIFGILKITFDLSDPGQFEVQNSKLIECPHDNSLFLLCYWHILIVHIKEVKGELFMHHWNPNKILPPPVCQFSQSLVITILHSGWLSLVSKCEREPTVLAFNVFGLFHFT